MSWAEDIVGEGDEEGRLHAHQVVAGFVDDDDDENFLRRLLMDGDLVTPLAPAACRSLRVFEAWSKSWRRRWWSLWS